MNGRVIFYCNALDEHMCAARGITTDSPAATRKVLAIAGALRAAGCDVLVASMGRGRVPSGVRFHRAATRSVDGVSFIYAPFITIPLLSELLSIGWLLWTAMRRGFAPRQSTRHLFYNQFVAYLPALVWLRLVRARTVVDLEDGPIDPQVMATLQTRGNAAPAVFARFISDGALIACRALALGTRIRPTLPCYGAIEPTPLQNRVRQAVPVVALLSGWLNEGTGADLLVAALRQLAAANDPRLAQLSVEVTGFGSGMEALSRLAVSEPLLRLTVHGRLSRVDYGKLLDRASIGLSLKTHASEYADTTFPSKVIEYAERGLCLVSTDISDVRHVFGDVARYVTADDPALLAAELVHAVDRPDDVRRRGKEARALVEASFTRTVVGSQLRAFLFPPTKDTR